MSMFDDLINSTFKNLHKDMIGALLQDGACTVPCRIHYNSTRFTMCSNCLYDNIGKKSSNRYKGGGPIPFNHGLCPVCNGGGKIQQIDTEIIYLATIWDSRSWYNIGLTQIQLAKINVQTMSKIDTYDNLMRATSIQLDTGIENYGIPQMVRVGEPQPCGLGGNHFIITSWTRA